MGNTFKTAWEPKQENKWNYASEYVYHEYPKWVSLADGSQILVHGAEEEQAAVGKPDNLRDALMAEAQALGLNPHHKTGEEKLRQLIAEARG